MISEVPLASNAMNFSGYSLKNPGRITPENSSYLNSSSPYHPNSVNTHDMVFSLYPVL